MSTNARCRLQKLYHDLQHWTPPQQRLTPSFSTIRSPDVTNKQVDYFSSTCSLQLQPPPAPKIYFRGAPAVSKKLAEQLAASKALAHIEEPKSRIGIPRWKKVILVDLDNMQIQPLILQQNPTTLFIMFVSRNGTTINRSQANEPNCKIVVTPVIGKDACDVHICYCANQLQAEHASSLFAVASRDHFANILVALMGNNTWHICNAVELDTFLKFNFNPSHWDTKLD